MLPNTLVTGERERERASYLKVWVLGSLGKTW